MKPIRVATAMFAVVCAACGSGSPDPTPSPARDTMESRGCPDGPCVRIVSPASGSTVRGGTVRIGVEVENFTLHPADGSREAGSGHLIYYRLESDNAEVPTIPGAQASSGGNGEFTSAASPHLHYDWRNTPGEILPTGDYTFVVQLVHGDSTPLDPPQTAQITVDAQA